MVSIVFKLLFISVFTGVLGSAQPFCNQAEPGSHACVEDATSLLQTASTVQTRKETAAEEEEDEQNAPTNVEFTACGCTCSISPSAYAMAKSSGYTKQKIQNAINGAGCSHQKFSDAAKASGHNIPSFFTTGTSCSAIVDKAEALVPKKYKQYLPMFFPKCTGNLALDMSLMALDSKVDAETEAGIFGMAKTVIKKHEDELFDAAESMKPELDAVVSHAAVNDEVGTYDHCGCHCSIPSLAVKYAPTLRVQMPWFFPEGYPTIEKVSCSRSRYQSELQQKNAQITLPSTYKSGLSCATLLTSYQSHLPAPMQPYLKYLSPTCTGNLQLQD